LAALELLVHLHASHLLSSYCSISVEFDDAHLEVIDPGALPARWMDYPAPSALQHMGDRWAGEQRSVVLQVPSVVVPTELNFILHPHHPAVPQVVLGAPKSFRFDPWLK